MMRPMSDRPSERATLPTRLARAALALPDPLIDRLIGAPPIVVDGRVLNRRVQAIMVVGERLGITDEEWDVEARRAQLRRIGSIGMPRRTGVYVTDRRIPGPESALPVRVYRRFGAEAEPPAIVYFHGGGWVVGDLDSHDGSCRLIADVTGCVVVAVDYRLAPEHPFPAPVDDALGAYRWVRTHARDLAIDADRVGVMGDSAGGNLAAVVAQVARDTDVPPPQMQALVYPATDAWFDQPSHELFAEGFFLSRPDMEWFRAHYVPDRADWDSPLVSPLRQEDLSGLAPAVLAVAGFDPLRDEGLAYGEAMAKAGVPVRSRCYDDMVHGFFGMGVLPEGPAMATEIAAAAGAVLRAA
jgi:acetyl esterase